MEYLRLFIEFFKVGLFSVGGGLATIPFLQEIAKNFDWYTEEQLVDMIAISESTPGPIGINMSTYAGFMAQGVLGGIVATLSLVLPSVVIIMLVSKFMQKFRNNRIVDNVFYGIRAASTGLIAGSILSVLLIGVYSAEKGLSIGSLVIYLAFVLLTYFTEKHRPIHPLIIIVLGGIVGALFGNMI